MANGRVSKASPSKRAGIKKEVVDSHASSFMDETPDMGTDGLVHDEDYGFTGGDLFGNL